MDENQNPQTNEETNPNEDQNETEKTSLDETTPPMPSGDEEAV